MSSFRGTQCARESYGRQSQAGGQHEFLPSAGQIRSNALGATGQSFVAISKLKAVNASTEDIAANWLPSVKILGQIKYAAANQEIARNVQQAAQGTMQVSSNITDVQRGASETGSASAQVLSAAQSLAGDSNRLKLEVGKFLDTVRAA
jgi:methyl-accepting chemotaxis protein